MNVKQFQRQVKTNHQPQKRNERAEILAEIQVLNCDIYVAERDGEIKVGEQLREKRDQLFSRLRSIN